MSLVDVGGDSEEMLVIDGSVLEGGGQILRMATAFSAIMRKPIRVHNIRAGRQGGAGLKAQHLTGIQLVRDICGGTLEGGQLGSTEIIFRPRNLTAGQYSGIINTAGSIGLLLQVALPCLIFAKGCSHLVLKGGTNVQSAPTIDYFIKILQPIIEMFGVKFKVDLRRRGFFPKGEGLVNVAVEPLEAGFLKPIQLVEYGTLTRVTGLAFTAGVLPMQKTHQMADSAIDVLLAHDSSLEVALVRKRLLPDEAFGNGCGILLVAKTSTNCLLGASAIGKKGVTDKEIGAIAAKELVLNLKHGGCVDNHLQDQLIIFMALAAGTSRIRCAPLTLHAQTAVHIAQIMTHAQFKVIDDKKDVNQCITLECTGHGLKY